MRVLIIDDEEDWQDTLQRTLSRGGRVECQVESEFVQARDRIQSETFDLIIVDLYLSSGEQGTLNPEAGMQLLREVRASELNRDCACVVLTAYGTPVATRDALKFLDASDFLEKDAFDRAKFLAVIQKALFEAALERARQRRSRKYRQTFFFTDTHVVFSELVGPDRFQDYVPDDPVRFGAGDLARRCDEINLLLTPPLRKRFREKWRREARSIGKGLYDALVEEGLFGQRLTSARDMPERDSDLWLCFRGSRKSLDVPFELLFDGQEHLGLRHPIFRRVMTAGPTAARKVAPFHVFLEKLARENKKLRILLLASNTGERVDVVDHEIERLEQLLHHRLHQTGIANELKVVPAAHATYARVEKLLRKTHYHIIHYAGHGRFDDGVAEKSSLFFRHGSGSRPMPASTLKDLLQESETYLFYLSCCLGARTEKDLGRGDFHGVMDSIVQADVPIVVGHRWVVSDGGARDLALGFYDALFATWSAEDALFEARRAVARNSPFGRDDETWASPVLVIQSP